MTIRLHPDQAERLRWAVEQGQLKHFNVITAEILGASVPYMTTHRLFVETIRGVTVATFADAELVACEITVDVRNQLANVAEGLGLDRVVLNFREVRLMSSFMFAVIFMFSRKVTAAQGKVKLCCLAPNLMEVFKILRFDQIFEIYEEESAAIDSF